MIVGGNHFIIINYGVLVAADFPPSISSSELGHSSNNFAFGQVPFSLHTTYYASAHLRSLERRIWRAQKIKPIKVIPFTTHHNRMTLPPNFSKTTPQLHQVTAVRFVLVVASAITCLDL